MSDLCQSINKINIRSTSVNKSIDITNKEAKYK